MISPVASTKVVINGALMTAGSAIFALQGAPRLGIPSLTVTDGPNGARGSSMFGSGEARAVCVPCGSALGATWDPALVEQVGEMLGVIRAQLHQYDDTTGAEHKFTGGAPFTAGIDWLYQDENGDGRRNQGAQAPYGDQKPTFGEQLFVAEHGNRSGTIPKADAVPAPA